MTLLTNRLTHLCTIERSSGTPDAWNQDTENWQPHLTGQPCRAWATAGSETVANTTTVVVVEDARLILPLGLDVTEGDRVAAVTNRGATILAGPLQIRAVLTHQDHCELVLVRAG